MDLVTFAIPLDKARSTTPTDDGYDYFPQDSISDPGIMLCPALPTTPFKFPFSLDEGQYPRSQPTRSMHHASR